MSGDCACLSRFPARDFKTAREADDFLTRVRMSPVFRYSGSDAGEVTRERFRCRTCGRDWFLRIPQNPPYWWGPLFEKKEETAPPPVVPPPPLQATAPPPSANRTPVASPIFLEVAGVRHERIGEFDVVYEDEAADDVAVVMRALLNWRPGLRTWAANAGLSQVEIELGARIEKNANLFDLFAATWPPDLVNPGWRAMRAGKAWRPVHLRGIRRRDAGAANFDGEYYLLVVNVKMENVVAWMMSEAKV